ncbi:MAG: ribosome silencing factor [Bacteroidales bacterium]|nr:ribosome silencing factor [Bacteroidales bacterium]NLM91629.1 ribosome silencing factor [Bacteroidales bacterium]
MVKPKKKDEAQTLVDSIVKGIQEKKGLEIVILDLAKLNSTVCDYFVICHGSSRPHVGAIADSVEAEARKATGYGPRRREGFSNAEWILLDYLDVVVHVFQEPVRQFYKLEALWADAPRTLVEGE